MITTTSLCTEHPSLAWKEGREGEEGREGGREGGGERKKGREEGREEGWGGRERGRGGRKGGTGGGGGEGLPSMCHKFSTTPVVARWSSDILVEVVNFPRLNITILTGAAF